jgi:hypothetical protein
MSSTQAETVTRTLDELEAWIRANHPGDLENDPELAGCIATLRATYAPPETAS